MKQQLTSTLLRSRARRLAPVAALCVAALMTASPAHAAFHLWTIRELYSDSSGSLQFIELFCTSANQNFLGGQQFTVTPTGGGAGHTFTLPSNASGSTANHAFLLGTAGIFGAGGPAPDAVIPSSFLFQGGGTISFFGSGGGAYSALPSGGVLSYAFPSGALANNSPVNFAGQAGLVVVPEPGTLALVAAGGIGLLCFLRRSKA